MNQAIKIINSVDGIKQIQYIFVLCNITGPENIVASHISNNIQIEKTLYSQ